jgi:hypothetical protein
MLITAKTVGKYQSGGAIAGDVHVVALQYGHA